MKTTRTTTLFAAVIVSTVALTTVMLRFTRAKTGGEEKWPLTTIPAQ
jgi:hypothetical protein